VRTGTTLLHHVISVNPATQNCNLLKLVYPTKTQKMAQNELYYKLLLLNSCMPEMKSIHPLVWDFPEECMMMMDMSMQSLSYITKYDIPLYQHWYEQADQTPAYEFHRRCLQYIQWRHQQDDKSDKPKQFVLKSPSHVGYISCLQKVFPDCCVIWLHRDPEDAIASCASMWAHFRSVYASDLDAKALGQQCLRYWLESVKRSMKVCDELQSNILHIRYDVLIKDPVATVEKVYQYFDFPPMNDDLRTRMSTFLKQSPKDKHGKHHYSLGQYGLTKAQVREAFQDYYKKFLSEDSVDSNLDAQLARKKAKA